jgi:hypothetical protein
MTRRFFRGAGGLLLAVHLLGTPGCIPVCPYYLSDTFWNAGEGDPMRQNVEKATAQYPPRIGIARREDILARLGEPDQASEDQREFIYRWRKVIGLVPSLPIKNTYLLRIFFDEEGVVRKVEYP